jgi:integrase
MASVRKRTWTTSAGERKIAWVVDFADTRGERQRKHFATKKAADAHRIKIEGALADGTHRPDADKVTVAELCARFLADFEQRQERNEVTKGTLVLYTAHVANHIRKDEIGAAKLSHLTARSVNEFRNRLRTTGVSVPTTKRVLATMRCALAFAVDNDLIAVNPARGIKVAAPRDEGSKRITPPSKKDLRVLIDAADEDFRLMLIFAASTGLRASEQWAVRWSDLGAAELRIYRRVDAFGQEGPPKSKAGVRTVPLSAGLVAMLKAWRLRSSFSKADDLIFPNAAGRHVSHRNVINRRLVPLFAKLEQAHTADPLNAPAPPTRFGWHALRHFAISTWIEARFTLKAIQGFAGHASAQMTLDRYGHLFEEDDHKRGMDTIAKGLIP